MPPTSDLQLLLGTGLCGALTTYSTFSYETLRLAQDGARLHAAANVVASVTAGLGAVFVGLAVARGPLGLSAGPLPGRSTTASPGAITPRRDPCPAVTCSHALVSHALAEQNWTP